MHYTNQQGEVDFWFEVINKPALQRVNQSRDKLCPPSLLLRSHSLQSPELSLIICFFFYPGDLVSLPALLMGEVMTVIGGDVAIVEAGKERQPLFLLLLAWEHSPTVENVSSRGIWPLRCTCRWRGRWRRPPCPSCPSCARPRQGRTRSLSPTPSARDSIIFHCLGEVPAPLHCGLQKPSGRWFHSVCHPQQCRVCMAGVYLEE